MMTLPILIGWKQKAEGVICRGHHALLGELK